MTVDEAQLVRVRRATAGDLAAVAAIERQCFADPWTEQGFASSLALPQARFLLAEEVARSSAPGEPGGAVLVGYVVALVVGDEAEVADLAVAPSARRRGIAGMLLDRFIAEAVESGVARLFLEVREGNAAARRLYESRMFSEVGRRRGYYNGPREDALVLRRDSLPT